MKNQKMLLIVFFFVVFIALVLTSTKTFATIKGKIEYSEEYLKYLQLLDEEKSKVDVVPRMYDIPLEDLYKEDNSTSKLFTRTVVGAGVPATYNLRNVISIPTEDQGQRGNCWIFASLNALETNLALKNGQNYDFSEMHVNYILSDMLGYNRELDVGGNFSKMLDYFMSNKGPVAETSVPYLPDGQSYSNAQIASWDSLTPLVQVTGVVDFPTIKKSEKTYTDTELSTFRTKIKEHIMTNGSVYATINSKDIKIVGGKKTLNTARVLRDASGINNGPDHAISIIGWDDNYAVTNFPEASRPTKPGAYIALNSWGEADWGDNIFYISYEDIWVEQEMSGVTSATIGPECKYKDIKIGTTKTYNILKNALYPKCINSNDIERTITLKEFAIDYLTYLDLSNLGLEDVDGVQGFTEVKVLVLDNNSITNVEPLAEMDDLMYISAAGNSVEDIEPIFEMESITNINFTNQKLKYNGLIVGDRVQLPPIFYQVTRIEGNTLTFTAKTYYAYSQKGKPTSGSWIQGNLPEKDERNYRMTVLLDKEVTETVPKGRRTLLLNATDEGFISGSTYSIEYTIPLTGDYDEDGMLTAFDAYSILGASIGLVTLTQEQESLLDVDEDGLITSFDAYKVLEASM